MSEKIINFTAINFSDFALRHRNKSLVLAIFFCSLIINFLTIAIAFYSMQIFDKVLNSSSVETLIYITLFTIILIYFLNYFSNFRFYLNQKIADNFAKIIFNNLRWEFDLSTKILAIEKLQKIKSFYHNLTSILFFDIILSILYFLVIFLIHPLIAFYSATILIILVITEKILQQKIDSAKDNFQKIYEENSKIFNQIHCNQNSKINFVVIENLFKRWRASYKIFDGVEKKYFATINYVNCLNKNLRLLAQIFSTMICAYLVIKNQISVGSIIAVSILLARMLEPFAGFINNLRIFNEFLLNRREILCKSNKQISSYQFNDKFIFEKFSNIIFTKVFYRDNKDKNQFIQIDELIIRPNKIIAIIANSSSQEFSIYNFLTKNYQLSLGSIEIDGLDIQKISQYYLTKNFEIIEGSPNLFSGSILENIAKMSPSFSVDEIINFIIDSGFDEEIKKSANGYLTDVKDLNYQQQYLVATLRAFYNKSKLIFFERPNSNQDLINFSQKFLATIRNYKNNNCASIFMINPAYKILKECDEVIIFKDGKLNFFNITEFFKIHEKTREYLN